MLVRYSTQIEICTSTCWWSEERQPRDGRREKQIARFATIGEANQEGGVKSTGNFTSFLQLTQKKIK